MTLDCKCKECQYRIALATMFDIHVWKEDCDRYETDYCGNVELKEGTDLKNMELKLSL